MKNFKIVTFVISILFAIFYMSCKKQGNQLNNDNLQGGGSIAGRLGYIDLYNGDSSIKYLGNKKVKIAFYPSDTLNYLYSTTTDSDGYFSFTNVANREYDIFFEDSINNILYTAIVKDSTRNNKVSLLAYPNTKRQNGVYLTTKDNLGGILTNTNVVLYSNKILYNDDSINNTTQNKSFSITTNPNGAGIKYNIPKGKYYCKALYTLSSVSLVGYGEINVDNNGISQLPITLQPSITRVDFFCVDSFYTPLKDVAIYLYLSRVIFNADTLGTAAVDSVYTNAYGTASKSNLKPAKYFVRANKALFGKRYSALDSVLVAKNIIVSDTLRVK